MIDTELQHGSHFLSLSSSIAGGCWHNRDASEGFQWWYFDALSSGGNDAIVIRFADRSIESPRSGVRDDAAGPMHSLPAVELTYFHEGRLICSTTNVAAFEQFSASASRPECTIGDSSFRFEEVEYGSGFRVEVSADLGRGRSVKAEFEWLVLEFDVLERPEADAETEGLSWNAAVPRADVSGRITVTRSGCGRSDIYHFRGSGYHDQYSARERFTTSIRSVQRGRAHFADATAVFCRHEGFLGESPTARLIVVQESGTTEYLAAFDVQEYSQSRFGAGYPSRIRIRGSENCRLRVKPFKIINSSRFTQQLLSEMTLTLRDGIPRRTVGIFEMISPSVSRFRLLNWLNSRKTR